jgi:hypothetical protein
MTFRSFGLVSVSQIAVNTDASLKGLNGTPLPARSRLCVSLSPRQGDQDLDCALREPKVF